LVQSKNKMNVSEYNWKASPSQVLNFFPFLITILGVSLFLYYAPDISYWIPDLFVPYFTWSNIYMACGVAFLYPAFKFIELKCLQYTLTEDKIMVKSGVLSSTIESIEMFRVKDQTIRKPFHLRVFGLGNLELLTSDPTTPTITFYAISDIDTLLSNIQTFTLAARKKHGVREFD